MSIRTKRTLCRVLGAAALLFMYCVISGMDLGTMPTGRGAALAITSELAGIFLLHKGSVFRVR